MVFGTAEKTNGDAEAGSDDTNDVTSSAISDAVPIAPDGGYGWVIVFAVFCGNLIIDGCAGSFGILYPELLTAFGASDALTSMAGSLIVAVFLFSSPLVGGLVNRFGCRLVCFVGGILTTMGFILATFAGSIYVFMLTYGIIGGLGIGFNSLSGQVMVNSYFSRRRGIAGGIVSSGAGFGVLIMAPLVQYLLQEYALRGTILLVGGITLQFCVLAVLMRPLTRKDVHVSTNTSESETVDHVGELKKAQLPADTAQLPLLGETPKILSNHEHVIHERHSYLMEDKISKLKSLHFGVDRAKNHFISTIDIHSNKIEQSDVSNLKSLPDLTKLKVSDASCSSPETMRVDANDPCHHNGTGRHSHSYRQIDKQNCDLKPLLRKDIFYSGSLHHLKEFQESKNMQAFVQSMTIPDPKVEAKGEFNANALETETKPSKRFKLLDIFKTSVYIPMLLGAIFIQMGQFIPSTFLPKYCEQIGIQNDKVSAIIAIYGAVNIFGRLSAGVLANFPVISPLWLCNGSVFLCAVSCALFPLCTSFATLCVFAVGFGFFIGYFPPLQVLIMVEYLGIERLTMSFGFLQMAKGPAALVGPPIAGLVYEWTKDYAMSMEFAALLFLLSAIVQSLVPCIDRFSDRAVSDKSRKVQILVHEADIDRKVDTI